MIPATWRTTAAQARRPAILVGAFYGLLVLSLLATHEWDPLFFATLGPQWARHDPGGAKRADGMIFYAFAVDPGEAAARFRSYRAMRILYPLGARVLALGQPAVIPWTLVLLNWAAIVLGTEVLHRHLVREGAPRWVALGYGAWAGLGAALLHDTSEAVTYLCALLGVYWLRGGRPVLGAGACGAAVLGRETALLFVLPYLIAAGRGRSGLRRCAPLLIVGVAGGLWFWTVWGGVVPVQLLRWIRPPLLGFASARSMDLAFSAVCLLGPAVAVTVLGIRGLVRTPSDPGLWAAVLNALLVVSLPSGSATLVWHSSRVGTGLVASSLLAGRLRVQAPRFYRAVAVLYGSSAAWTIAVGVRYLFWDVVAW